MKIIRLISFFAILLTMSQLAFAQTAKQLQKLIQVAEATSNDKFNFGTKSRKGAIIYGVSKPTKEMLAAIDKGLDGLFAVARKNGYYSHLRYSDYIIFIAKPDRLTDSDGNYIPNFAIPVRQYAGTAYDKGGYMYAAGIVLAFSPSAFMIAENAKKLEQVSEVVRYEGEHLVLYYNDRAKYEATADHSKGGGHPILK